MAVCAWEEDDLAVGATIGVMAVGGALNPCKGNGLVVGDIIVGEATGLAVGDVDGFLVGVRVGREEGWALGALEDDRWAIRVGVVEEAAGRWEEDGRAIGDLTVGETFSLAGKGYL